jgi:hypothetical protein
VYAGANHAAVVGGVLLSTDMYPWKPSTWIGFIKLEGTLGQDPQVKNRPMPLTLGLGFLSGHHLPPPDPPAYWPMEPSDPTTFLRGHRETPCAIHGWSSCSYPVASRWTELSSLSPREGGKGVAVTEEDDEEDPVEIIPVLNSPPRLAPIHTA